MQHPVARVVVEEAISGRGAAGRRPTGQASIVVIAHVCACRITRVAGVPARDVGIAAGHVAHGIIGGVLVGHALHRSQRIDLFGVATGRGIM